MRTGFKVVKIPTPVYNNFMKKKERLEKIHFEVYGKRKNIPFSKVLMAFSSKDIYLNDFEIKQLTRRRVFHI